MRLPSVNDVHQDAILTNLSIRYSNELYIAQQVLPKVTVGKASDKFYVFNQSDFFRNEAGRRAAGTEGPVGGYRLSTDTYATDQRSMAVYVADEERTNADAGLDLEVQAVEYCADKVLLGLEAEVASVIFTSTNYATNHSETLTGTNQWSDATSTPISAIDTAGSLISSKIGRKPNLLVLGEDAFLQLKNHPDIAEVLKYTQAAVITEQLLASVLQVDRVLVGRAIYDSAGEGDTDVYARVWTADSAALLYVAPSAGLRTLSYGYSFVWQGFDMVTERWREPRLRSDGFRTIHQWDTKVTCNTAGYLWSDVKA